jgi:NADPH:quinone reductase-like Zn-dependent oxidoreductase
LAEYAVASVTTTAKRPDGVSAIDGCSLPIAGVTALQAIRDTNGAGLKLDGTSKANLLITGASGGVGTYAVQVSSVIC